MDGVRICKTDHTVSPESSMSGTVLAVIAQGGKRLALGDRVYEYGAGQYLVASVDLPVTGHVIDAVPGHPTLSFGMTLDVRPLIRPAPRMDPPFGVQHAQQRSLRGTCAVHAFALTACTSLALPEAGGKGARYGGLAKPAASSPSAHGPGVQRRSAHPAVLGPRPCRGARQCGPAASACTCRIVPLCDADRGHWQGSARIRRRGERGRDTRHGRSRPLATQSRGTSGIYRGSGPAGACSLPPQVRAREGRPRSPLREELGPSGSSSSGVSPPLPPDATGFGNAPATS
jgi:hypothetical protein